MIPFGEDEPVDLRSLNIEQITLDAEWMVTIESADGSATYSAGSYVSGGGGPLFSPLVATPPPDQILANALRVKVMLKTVRSDGQPFSITPAALADLGPWAGPALSYVRTLKAGRRAPAPEIICWEGPLPLLHKWRHQDDHGFVLPKRVTLSANGGSRDVHLAGCPGDGSRGILCPLWVFSGTVEP